VVDDLSTSSHFNKLSFVAGPPHMRFYAGTPLTTENGINIGAFFVLDTEPRAGLDAAQQETLGNLASLAMDFLRVSRQASDGRRASRLSRGLNCFVEGSSSFVDGLNSRQTGSVGSSASPPAHFSSIASSRGSRNSRNSRHSPGSSVDVRSGRSPVASVKGEHGAPELTTSGSTWEEQAETGSTSDVMTPLPDWLSGSNGQASQLGDERHSHHWAFRRAANLIRESLELSGESGVLFLESSNTPLDAENGRLDYFEDSDTPAPVLAISTKDEPFAPEPGSTATCEAANFERRFLQQVLRRYPKGKIWTFHTDRSLFASSDDDENGNPNSPVSVVKTPDVSRGTQKKWRATETALLAKYFPNASQTLFVPLWNAATSQWFAGCFCWTTNETQVFSPAVELASIMGFGYSIMAECSRVESVIADRQKGDFIGSISHELRSPLHGILAAAEFLDGTHVNEFQQSLLETINACGRTLLDTMNQVLDFSKIVSLEKSWRQMKRSRGQRRDVKEDADSVSGIDSMAALLDTCTCENIAVLAEEVVEGVCLGHSYGRSTSRPSHSSAQSRAGSSVLSTPSDEPSDMCSDVEVIVDIEEGDWIYRTQPGALRRIIMNIFGNAMKYTENGHIKVRLETVQATEKATGTRSNTSGELVVLTVSDTGKGISEDFLRARLYTPFAQEDTLAVGTGLGLSIVRSIVRSLGGHIGIRSQAGEGTTVQVSLPLARPSADDASARPLRLHQRGQGQEMNIIREHYGEKSVAILGYDPSSPTASESAVVLARYVTQWLGLRLEAWPTRNFVDLILAQDRDMTEQVKTESASHTAAMTVFCSNSVECETYRQAWSSVATSIDFLYRPCGPHKLARSILRSLKQSCPAPVPGPTGSQPFSLVDRSRTSIRQVHRDDAHSQLGPEREREPQPQLQSQSQPDRQPDRIPSLLQLRHNSDPHTATTRSHPSAISEESSAEDYNDEGVTGRRSALTISPPGPTDGKDKPIATLPADQSLDTSASAPIKVLVVDDNYINLRLLLTYLSRRNVGVLDSAENGKMALEAVEKRSDSYDIIFMGMFCFP
jgi:signal transduction histidine kinase